MKKTLFILMIAELSMIAAQTEEAQPASSSAAIQWSGEGLNQLETKTLFNYFLGELKKASGDEFLDQEAISDKISDLAITTEDCQKKNCLKEAQVALASELMLAGTIKFSKNKYRVKVKKVSASGKSKSYKIRYRGETDGFVTELEILAWKVMGATAPDRLMGKRKPNQETLVEKIAENPWAQKGLVFGIAGFSGSTYLKNTAGAVESQKKIDSLPDYDIGGIKAHTDSRDGAQMTATISLVTALATVTYGYFTGVFSPDE